MNSLCIVVPFHTPLYAHRFLGITATPTSSFHQAYSACNVVISCTTFDSDHGGQCSESPMINLEIASITMLVLLGNEAETFHLSALRQAYGPADQ